MGAKQDLLFVLVKPDPRTKLVQFAMAVWELRDVDGAIRARDWQIAVRRRAAQASPRMVGQCVQLLSEDPSQERARTEAALNFFLRLQLMDRHAYSHARRDPDSLETFFGIDVHGPMMEANDVCVCVFFACPDFGH